MLRTMLILFLAGLVAATQTQSADHSAEPATDANILLGTWQVDLRPTPDAEPYYQELVVTEVDGKTFQGTFYGTPLTEGRINTDWSTVRIAFVTADGSGPYNHSAVLVDGKLEGMTNSLGREFLSYWSAIKP